GDRRAAHQPRSCLRGACRAATPFVSPAPAPPPVPGSGAPPPGPSSTPPMEPCNDGDPCTADSCDPVAGCVFQPLTGLGAATCMLVPQNFCQPIPDLINKAMAQAESLITDAGKAKKARAKKLVVRAQRALKRAAKKANKLSKNKNHPLSPACAQALTHTLLEASSRLETVKKSL